MNFKGQIILQELAIQLNCSHMTIQHLHTIDAYIIYHSDMQ